MNHISHPNAKINLGLYVVGLRPDGYHNIQTIFYPIPLCDSLEVSEDDDDNFQLSGIPVAGNPDDNLVIKVLQNLRRDYDIPPVHISLTKRIPSGAGLGGGSSDAAFMMMALNELFHLELPNIEMEQRVSTLGADCAFFIRNRATLAQGIGNEFSDIKLSLHGWHLVLVKPDDFVSTREAYASIMSQLPAVTLESAIQLPVGKWRDKIFNDFEQSVFPQHPTIAGIKHTLYQLGATYACMSGSGSTVFALFDQKPQNLADIFNPHFVFEADL